MSSTATAETSMDDSNPEGEMPFLDHIRELRSRLMWSIGVLGVGCVFTYIYYDNYIDYVTKPFRDLGLSMTTLKPTDAFMARIRFSIYAALIFSMPYHVYNALGFIIPALTKKEKKVFKWFGVGSMMLFIVGFYIGFFFITPLSISFLNNPTFFPEAVKADLVYKDCVMFVMQILLAAVVMFQIPLLLEILMAMNIVKRKTLLDLGRYIIVGTIFMSALFTPPDIVTQIGLAIPLIFLFYLSILIAKIFGFGDPDPDEIILEEDYND
jgi:sec-independent protein translocase protein TatC